MAVSEAGQAVDGWRGMMLEGAEATIWVEDETLWLVCNNDGRGSDALAAPITDVSSTQLTATYDGVDLIIDGPRADRFLARVDVADDATILMSVVKAVRQPVRVTYKSREDAFVAKIDGVRASWPAAALGVTEEAIGHALTDRLYQPLGVEAGAPGHWLLDEGSLDQFVRVARERRASKQRGREQQRQREAKRGREALREERHDSHFVNPYTFVPLPAGGPLRSEPPGHDHCADDRPLVRLEITWTAVTPLATRTPYEHRDARSGLAGSAVKGTLRSCHEALTGSCLRVVDLDAAPVHREQMQAGQGDDSEKPESWRVLARVLKIAGPDASGVWTMTMEVARRTVWVPSTALDRPVTSGTVHDLTGVHGTVGHHKGLRRYQLTEDAKAPSAFPHNAGIEWIPLVSHAGARKSDHGYHVPFGEFCREGIESRRPASLRSDSPVWREYQEAAKDSLDEACRRRGDPIRLEVHWKHDGRRVLIGRRQAVRSDLEGPDKIATGHLFWVNLRNDGEVTNLAAAYVWRRSTRTRMRDRIRGEFWPCTDPAELCLSCQVFGGGGATSVDADPDVDDGEGYRGHVRIGPMLTDVASTRVPCAPLNAPRIGAGQFYLEPPAGAQRAEKEATPLREWESGADAKRTRSLRGRKFYWPADPDVQRQKRGFEHPRWRAEQTPYGQGNRGQEADVWDAGTAFHQTITIVGLDRVRLGGLLAAMRPDLLAAPTAEDWSRAVVRMGYGKPLGLGVLRASHVAATVHTPTDRYGPAQAPPRTVPLDELASWVADFVASVDDGVRDTWPDLRAVTDPEHVWPEFVSYPIERWEHYPQEGEAAPPAKYRFTFWKESAGGDKSDLVPLPAARSSDQLLPLDPSKDRENL